MKSIFKLGASCAALIIAGTLVSCAEQETSAPSSSAALGSWGVDTTSQLTTIKPGDDFNRYANGTWYDGYEIPGDLSSFNQFTKLRLEAEENVRAIVEELAATEAQDGSLEQKVGDYFKTWMDEDKLNEMGSAPLKPYLDEIYAYGTHADLTKVFASLHNISSIGIGIIPDPADTTKYIAFVGQSGLGLPDRDYYLKDEDKFIEYRSGYKDYIASVLTLAGIDDGAAKAESILALETKIAEVHWSQEDSRDIQKIYNPMSIDQLTEAAPTYDWPAIFGQLSLNSVETFLVAQPSAIDGAGKILQDTDFNVVKDYLAFHMIRNNAQDLSSDFDDAHFEFYSKTLRGVEEKRERWKRGINRIDRNLGEAVGQIYVDRHFPADYKEKMDALVANLTDAFAERLEQNDWMDAETKEQALLKLSTFEPRIGYTEKWTDFGSLSIKDGSMLENSRALTEFQWAEQVRRLAGPVDRQLWPYPPQTVNASYSPLLNQITFPAGILQPPFFDPNADPAVNYGGIGAVIGHEIGHGFDDQGRRFDEKGRIRDWWTKASDEAFQKKTDALGAQYSSYEPLPDTFVNGELTMGENIGDLGGLQMAYAAYHRYLDETSNGVAPEIDGLTGDQRFFLGWAQVWQAKYREDALRQRILTDPHSPAQYRINGIVRNLDAWYEAFGVTEEDALYLPPEERVRIW